MSARIVITGMGIISPYGVGTQVLWNALIHGTNGLKALTSFETSHIRCRVGGQLTDFEPEAYLSRRQVHKIDRFSVFGLVAVQQALQHANLLLDNGKPFWSHLPTNGERVGLTVGNNLGGWTYAERELRNLWQKGPQEVSPYMATAWFPAAVQGNVSIQFGIKGMGRTFLSDRASGAYAIIHAAYALQQNKADIMIAGGTEAPFSPYAALCYETSGLMSSQAETYSTTAYRPFDRLHDGLVAGEGAAFFVLERADDALRRGAHILAELCGWATTNDGYDFVRPAPDGRRFADAMIKARQQANMRPEDIDCLFAAGSAVPEEDISETRAIHLAFEDTVHDLPISAPKAAFGNLFGAAFPLDVAIALLAMEQRTIPPTANLEQPADECDLDYVSQTARAVDHLDNCMVNARGIGGANASLLVQHWSKDDHL